MSRTSAAPQPPEDRLESIAVRLRTHEWVQDARAVESASGAGFQPLTILVVPAAAAVRSLRRQGKQSLVVAWEQHLRTAGLTGAERCEWRLLHSLPAAGREPDSLEALATRRPVISDLVRDPQSPWLTCRLMIPYELPVFRGHFPSTPIVPGVVQVGWAVDLARAHGLASAPFAGISQAKFRRLVQPGMTLELRLEHDPAAGQLCFRYSLGSTVVSTGRVQFRSTDA